MLDEKFAFTIEELVKRGCGSRTFLYEIIGAGDLKAVKRGTRTMVLNTDFQAWLRSLPAPAISPPKPRKRRQVQGPARNRDNHRGSLVAA
jgi:hypothetical protein